MLRFTRTAPPGEQVGGNFVAGMSVASRTRCLGMHTPVAFVLFDVVAALIARAQVWNTHNWTCHKEVLGHGDEIWALAVIGDRLISGSIDRYEL